MPVQEVPLISATLHSYQLYVAGFFVLLSSPPSRALLNAYSSGWEECS